MTVGFSPAQYYANSYMWQALMGGEDNYMGIGPIYSDAYPFMGGASNIGFNPSMWNSNIYGQYGGYPYGGGYGAGIQGAQQLLQAQQDIQDFRYDQQVHNAQRQDTTNFKLGNLNDPITRQIAVLKSKIDNNEQDRIGEEYNKLVSLITQKYASHLKEDVVGGVKNASKAYADKLYFEATGTSITDNIRAKGSGSFTHGLKQSLLLGMYHRKTAEQNIADIQGTKIDRLEKVKKGTGNVVGGTALGTGIGAAIGALFNKWTGGRGALWGAKAGAIIGTALGSLKAAAD